MPALQAEVGVGRAEDDAHHEAEELSSPPKARTKGADHVPATFWKTAFW
jgi:hypothetical protein